MKVLVIIVSYNAMQWIDRCLGGLRASTVPCDVLMVDNGSTDGTMDYVREHFPEVQIEPQSSNLGFGRANNVGLRLVVDRKYDYAYLLNQDAWLQPDSLELLISAMKSQTSFGILSPMQLSAEGRLDKRFARYMPARMKKDAALVAYWSAKVAGGVVDPSPAGAAAIEVRFAQAAHWLMSREAVETVGGFSPTFAHYGEDNNYADRLKYHGLRIGVVPAATAVHDRSQRKPGKEARMRLKCIKPLVKLSNPGKNQLFSRIKEPFRMLGISIKNLSLLPLRELPVLLRRYPEIARNREASKSRGAFL